MHKDLFHEKVKIKNVSCPVSRTVPQNDVIRAISRVFGENIKFYEVLRPFGGLAHSAIVFKVSKPNKNEYYTYRLFERGQTNNDYDLATEMRNRVLLLIKALKQHIPPITFIDDKKFVIIVQEFVFDPVCQFNDIGSLYNLLEIIMLASIEEKLVLDYNHNHWLYNNKREILYYVDYDFMGQPEKDQRVALRQNLHQAMIFVASSNCEHFKAAFEKFIAENFFPESSIKMLIDEMNYYIRSWNESKIASKPQIKAKVGCISSILKNYTNNTNR